MADEWMCAHHFPLDTALCVSAYKPLNLYLLQRVVSGVLFCLSSIKIYCLFISFLFVLAHDSIIFSFVILRLLFSSFNYSLRVYMCFFFIRFFLFADTRLQDKNPVRVNEWKIREIFSSLYFFRCSFAPFYLQFSLCATSTISNWAAVRNQRKRGKLLNR